MQKTGGGNPTPAALFLSAANEPFPAQLILSGRQSINLSVFFRDQPKDNSYLPDYVHVVDDDRDVRRSISFMLGAAELQSRPFGSGKDLLDSLSELQPGSILLDIRMPDMDGFQVMEELTARGIEWPVVVMTGHGQVSVAVRAMKMGAVDFLEKPFEEGALLASLERSFLLLRDRSEKAERRRKAEEKIGLLSGREREVLRGLLAGFPNKVLARQLDISLRTVEMHRANMMERLGVGSLAEALTLAVQAGVEPLEQE
jgi:two-component system response regulator FixJ